LASLTLAAGCSLEISRTRINVPLDQEAFQELEVGRTTRSDALKKLGAPDLLEYKGERDHLWYLHKDDTQVGLRFRSPISLFGYRHTFARLNVDAEDTSAMRLIFTNDGVLEKKSLRMAAAYSTPEITTPGWRIYLMPRYGYAPLDFGDGGQEDYGDLFSSGHLFGGYLGILPNPYFMILLGGNYQLHNGSSLSTGGVHLEMGDLRMYQLEVGGRFQVPPRFFVSFWDIDKLKELFYTDDLSRYEGLRFIFQWTLGGTINEDVGVKIDGVPGGTYFDKSVAFSTTIGVGLEYRWRRLGIFGTADYQLIGPFRGGTAPLNTDAGDYQSLIVGGGLSFRF